MLSWESIQGIVNTQFQLGSFIHSFINLCKEQATIICSELPRLHFAWTLKPQGVVARQLRKKIILACSLQRQIDELVTALNWIYVFTIAWFDFQVKIWSQNNRIVIKMLSNTPFNFRAILALRYNEKVALLVLVPLYRLHNMPRVHLVSSGIVFYLYVTL